jgi:hypothetical protein
MGRPRTKGSKKGYNKKIEFRVIDHQTYETFSYTEAASPNGWDAEKWKEVRETLHQKLDLVIDKLEIVVS